MANKYLFLAYGFLWLIFILYAGSLSRRLAKLSRELEDLKARAKGRVSSDRPS